MAPGGPPGLLRCRPRGPGWAAGGEGEGGQEDEWRRGGRGHEEVCDEHLWAELEGPQRPGASADHPVAGGGAGGSYPDAYPGEGTARPFPPDEPFMVSAEKFGSGFPLQILSPCSATGELPKRNHWSVYCGNGNGSKAANSMPRIRMGMPGTRWAVSAWLWDPLEG